MKQLDVKNRISGFEYLRICCFEMGYSLNFEDCLNLMSASKETLSLSILVDRYGSGVLDMSGLCLLCAE